jgi:hypothetical protein
MRPGAAARRSLASEPRLLTPVLQKSTGYFRVTLCRENRRVNVFIHRLVLEIFRSAPTEGMQGAHLNGQRDDNRLDNLKWCSPLENTHHKFGHGTMACGIRNGNVVLNDDAVLEIRRLYAAGGHSQPALARQFNVSQASVWNIVHLKSWRHLV